MSTRKHFDATYIGLLKKVDGGTEEEKAKDHDRHPQLFRMAKKRYAIHVGRVPIKVAKSNLFNLNDETPVLDFSNDSVNDSDMNELHIIVV